MVDGCDVIYSHVNVNGLQCLIRINIRLSEEELRSTTPPYMPAPHTQDADRKYDKKVFLRRYPNI